MQIQLNDEPEETRTRRRRRLVAGSDRRRGQGLVEFAFCAPLLLLLLLGTLDFGQIFFEYIQMRSAVREGAVYAARYSVNGEDSIKQAVRESGGVGGILDDGGTTITVEFSTDLADIDFGDEATVTITAERTFHPTMLSFFQRFGLDTVTLTASSDAKVWT